MLKIDRINKSCRIITETKKLFLKIDFDFLRNIQRRKTKNFIAILKHKEILEMNTVETEEFHKDNQFNRIR